MSEPSGDDFLSSIDHKLWQLHRHIIFQWGVYTLFKYQMMNVPQGLSGTLSWYIPEGCDEQFEIRQWLEQELTQFESDPVDLGYEDGSGKIPGHEVHIHIMEFTGLDWYMDVAEVKSLAEDAARTFMNMLDKRKKK